MTRRKIASAISYAPEDPAPRLVVSGQGREAEWIIALAEKAGVTVVEDPALAALLNMGVKTGEIIPVWCWEAAAKILAFVLAKEKR